MIGGDVQKSFTGDLSHHEIRMTGVFTHLYIEVFKCHSVSPEQLHGVPRYESDSKETLHLVRARSLGHLVT